MGDAGYAVVDFGRFVTGFLVVMGIALPVLLAHCALIQVPAMAMSIIGGMQHGYANSADKPLTWNRLAHLWNDYQLHSVFQGGTGLLKSG